MLVYPLPVVLWSSTAFFLCTPLASSFLPHDAVSPKSGWEAGEGGVLGHYPREEPSAWREMCGNRPRRTQVTKCPQTSSVFLGIVLLNCRLQNIIGWPSPSESSKDDVLVIVGLHAHQLTASGRFDVGPSIILVPSAFEEAFDAMGVKLREVCEFIKVDPTYSIHFHDGTKLSLTNDFQRMERQVNCHARARHVMSNSMLLRQ